MWNKSRKTSKNDKTFLREEMTLSLKNTLNGLKLKRKWSEELLKWYRNKEIKMDLLRSKGIWICINHKTFNIRNKKKRI